MTLQEAREHIGDQVVYTPDHDSPEDGVITSVGERYVFVRYGFQSRGKATPAEKLRLA